MDGLSLRMYENQINVLLGHNGAGKGGPGPTPPPLDTRAILVPRALPPRSGQINESPEGHERLSQ